MNQITLNEIAAETRAQLKRIEKEAQASGDKREEKVVEVLAKQGELQARLSEVEQLLLRRHSGGDAGGGAYHDAGSAALRAALEGSAELQAVADRKLRRTVVDLPTGFFASITSGGGLGLPQTLPADIVAPVKRRMTIRSLIPSVPTTAGAVQFTRETGFTNRAAIVSETTTKPTTDITFELRSAPIATIAHVIRCALQTLADTPQLMQYLDGRLRYGVALAEEEQLLRGSGVGNNIEGLMTAATAFAGSGGGTRIDVLRRAITQLENTDFQASGIVLSPTDWESIALTKSSATEQYIVGEPGGANPAMLWNLPVIVTPAMIATDFLVADFPAAALLFDREQARIDVSTETEDDFVTNQCHIRCEERLGCAVLRTGALIAGSFGGTT